MASQFIDARASTEIFSSYNRICLLIFDLQADRQYKLRDEIGSEMVPALQDYISKHRVPVQSVTSRPNCLPPESRMYGRQILFELYVNRQILNIKGDRMHVAVVSGASSNARGVLSHYELQPTIVVDSSEISDSAIKAALIQFVIDKLLSRPWRDR